MTRLAIPLVLAVALAAGCRGPSPAGHLERAADAERRSRLQRVAEMVFPEDGIDVDLSANAELGAWSWPDGRIRVSRALVDRVDDGALAAALAHEIGHLLDQRHLDGVPLGLGGAPGGDDLELRADRIGCDLLAHRGLPRVSMRRLLAVLAADSAAGGLEFERRIAAAGTACGP